MLLDIYYRILYSKREMVSATESPQTFRVSFAFDETPTSQLEIVCFVRPHFEGIEILYSHHIRRWRDASRGPWQEQGTVRLTPLTTQLVGIIRAGVMAELFDKFIIHVRDIESAVPFGDTTRRVLDIEGKLPGPDALKDYIDGN